LFPGSLNPGFLCIISVVSITNHARVVVSRGFDPGYDRGTGRGYQRTYSRQRSGDAWDEEELPEWSLDGEADELGTFDASGAFVSPKKVSISSSISCIKCTKVNPCRLSLL